jgi:hypothetical protein
MILFAWMAAGTSERYFGEYRATYNSSTHPTGEGAAIARAMMAMGVDLDHIYVVGWANGWDYRALGAHLGDPYYEGLLFGSGDGSDAVLQAGDHVSDPAAKLYFVGGEYAPRNLEYLEELYPDAVATHHMSTTTGKDFWSVFVPARDMEADGE